MKTHATIDESHDRTLAQYGRDEKTRANIESARAHAHRWLDWEQSGKWLVRGSVQTEQSGFAGQPQSVYASRYFATEAEAQAEAARFPKSAKVRSYRVCGENGLHWGCSFHLDLRPSGVTGDVNETGLRRLRAFVKLAPDFIFVQDYISNFLKREAFDALVA